MRAPTPSGFTRQYKSEKYTDGFQGTITESPEYIAKSIRRLEIFSDLRLSAHDTAKIRTVLMAHGSALVKNQYEALDKWLKAHGE